jgi:branched-chain amino acid transport system ATP-binding protein
MVEIADNILEAHELTRSFGGFVAVNHVTLKVRRHGIHALIGPNGAGKTTVFNLLTKFLQPSAGQIVFEGRDVTRARPADIARLGIVRSFQISAVFLNMTVLDNVRVALQRCHDLSHQFWASRSRLEPLDDEAKSLLESVNLGAFGHLRAAELPYGRKRALEIATTLALDPKLLLLDEPMAGMSHEDIDKVTALVRQAARGRTVLMVEHNLGVVADLCDHVTVLSRGEILAEGTYSVVSADARVRDAYMGTENE